MLSIPNRAAVCFVGFALSGCMQTMPSAEDIARPTREAFARLSSWGPWSAPGKQAAPPVVVSQNADPVIEAPEAKDTDVRPEPKPRRVERAARRTRPLIQPAVASPAGKPAKVVPAAAPAPPIEKQPAPEPLLPATVTCQTVSQAGERVRMECTPVE